jgi:hypothetical protein
MVVLQNYKDGVIKKCNCDGRPTYKYFVEEKPIYKAYSIEALIRSIDTGETFSFKKKINPKEKNDQNAA